MTFTGGVNDRCRGPRLHYLSSRYTYHSPALGQKCMHIGLDLWTGSRERPTRSTACLLWGVYGTTRADWESAACSAT